MQEKFMLIDNIYEREVIKRMNEIKRCVTHCFLDQIQFYQ
jgi:hypothetical protein